MQNTGIAEDWVLFWKLEMSSFINKGLSRTGPQGFPWGEFRAGTIYEDVGRAMETSIVGYQEGAIARSALPTPQCYSASHWQTQPEAPRAKELRGHRP